MTRLAHVVNPVAASPSSELGIAQPITFETMRRARETAAHTPITLYAVNYPEDDTIVPPDFVHLPHLTRSVQDVKHFSTLRKLPLLADILARLVEASDADYLIYTNVDIALQPHFYTAVRQFIEQGYDAFAINRRTIPGHYRAVDQLPAMYAEPGLPHRGWDCFVFSRALAARFDLGHICLGAPRIGLAFLANLVAWADNFHEFTDEHLTFHIGDDRRWRGKRPSEFARHNTTEADAILKRLEQTRGPFPRNTPVGMYLFKKRVFGPFYDAWVNLSDVSVTWSRKLNGGLSRLLSRRTEDA